MANAAITVDLNARIAKFETELKKATGSLDRFEKKGDQLAASFKNAFGSLGVAIGAGVVVRKLSGMADEFKNLQARLKLASRDTVEFNAANADLIRISQSAQAPLSETATLYTRIAASVKDLDVSQRAIADTTEAVALSLKISGASGAEASSAMLQFSQAMASGVLRGEEFNSVNEAAPRLLQALAASLNVPVGSLREMAKEGQLTRDVLINGLLSELPKLQAEAATLPKTIGAAFTDLNNKLLITIGHMDDLTGATGGVSAAISGIGTTGIEALSVLGANVAFVFKGIGNEIGGIGAQLSRLAVGDFQGFSAIGRMMKADAVQARKELDEFEKKILGVGKTASRAASSGAPVTAPALGAKASKKTGVSKADPQGAFIAKLRQEAETLGLSGEALQRYEAIKLKLTGTNKQLADSYISQIAEFKRLAGDQEFATLVMQDGQETINQANQNMRDWEETVKSAGQELTDMISPVNVLIRKLTDLDKFDGFIDPEVLAAARLEINAQIDAIGEVDDKLLKANDTAKELGMTFTSAFENAIVKGNKFKDVLKGLAQDLLRIMAREAIVKPLANAAGSFAASLFASANGNVISSPALSAYSGSVVSSPTVFPFASGIGLMGEAGPEAILPLKRGSNGKLGVESSGGSGVVVSNTYNIDARGADAGAEQRIRRAMAESEDRAVSRSVTQVQSMNQRGQLRLA